MKLITNKKRNRNDTLPKQIIVDQIEGNNDHSTVLLINVINILPTQDKVLFPKFRKVISAVDYIPLK